MLEHRGPPKGAALFDALVGFSLALGRLPFSVVAALSVLVLGLPLLFLPGLRLDPQLLFRSTDPRVETIQKLSAAWARSDLLLVELPHHEPLSPVGYERLEQVVAALKTSESWTTESLVAMFGAVHDASSAKEVLEKVPFLRSLFVAQDGRGWLIFLSMSKSAQAERLTSDLEAVRVQYPEILIGGSPWYLEQEKVTLGFNVLGLLALAGILVLVIYLVLVRNGRMSALMWLFSILPPAALLGFLAMSGQSLKITLVLPPFFALALSTSYLLQLYYGWSLGNRDLSWAWGSRGPVILLDGAAAMLGFATFLGSPVSELQAVGALTGLAVLLALFSALVAFPAVLRWRGEHLPITVTSEASQASNERVSLGLPARLLMLLSLLVLLPGLAWVKVGGSFGNDLSPWSPASAEFSVLERAYGGFEEILVQVDTHREGGLTDLTNYRAIRGLQEALATQEGVRDVLGYGTVVEASLAWQGVAGGKPETEADIAESLELLTSNAQGGLLGSLVSPDWSKCLLTVRLRPDGTRPRLLEVSAALDLLLTRQELDARLFGNDLATQLTVSSVVRDQLFSLVFLFLMYGVLLALATRSLRLGFLALLPALAGALGGLALMGWLGWQLSGQHAVAFAAIAAIGIDSAIMFLLVETNTATLRAIRDAIFLLCVILSTLMLSSFYTLVQISLVMVTGLIISLVLVRVVLSPLSRSIKGSRLVP